MQPRYHDPGSAYTPGVWSDVGRSGVSADGMTSRERLLAALRGDAVDRIPW